VYSSVTPWTITLKAPLSMGFPRQEHWSGLPFPSPMRESERCGAKGPVGSGLDPV